MLAAKHSHILPAGCVTAGCNDELFSSLLDLQPGTQPLPALIPHSFLSSLHKPNAAGVPRRASRTLI